MKDRGSNDEVDTIYLKDAKKLKKKKKAGLDD